MKLSIYSLKQVLFEGEASLVNCQTVSGEITVLDHHRALISILRAGVVKIVDGAKEEKYFEVKGGFIEIQPDNVVRLLVDQ